jgi:serine protease Do
MTSPKRVRQPYLCSLPYTVFALFALPFHSYGQTSLHGQAMVEMDQFSHSVEALTARVSPSVVRILVNGVETTPEGGRTQLRTGLQESLGSGVIVDPDGYILTNAHVVDGAERIRVNIIVPGQDSVSSAVANSYAPPVEATLVGTFKEGDLALIKVARTGLPALKFAEYHNLKQGQIVFAFGSPAGLQNSVSMGLVSAVARQPNPDSPFLFIQTDTPINPGNSGGPLVNSTGEVVGLNTFILSRSGGNEGVGFAIPSTLLQWVVPQLKKQGHVHRSTVGIGVQQITPPMAAALRLSRTSGVIVSDIRPGGPAEAAGIKMDDILLSMDHRPVETVPSILGSSFQHSPGDRIEMTVLRGNEQMHFDVATAEEPHKSDKLAELADPVKNTIPQLGILGLTVDQQNGLMPGSLRLPTGVLVVARVQSPNSNDPGFQIGDVIHSVNGKLVYSMDDLRTGLTGLNSGDPVALLTERDGELSYVSFELP